MEITAMRVVMCVPDYDAASLARLAEQTRSQYAMIGCHPEVVVRSYDAASRTSITAVAIEGLAAVTEGLPPARG